MDIDLLSKMVKELILDNDRVVLPGLGSFVAELVPSSFSDKGYTINPPYRRLYFRSVPNEGTLLARFYSSTNNIQFDIAERIIIDFTAELKQILHSKKTVVFPGLGRLRATKENNIFFVADEDLDIYPAGFGLEPISLKTHQETREEVSAAVAGLKSLMEELPLKQEAEPLKQEAEPVIGPGPSAEPVREPEKEAVEYQAVEPQPAESQEDLQETAHQIAGTEPVSESLSKVAAGQDAAEEQSSIEITRDRRVLKVILILTITIILLAVMYAVVGRIWPEWIDRFLYSPEELKILNYKL